jgi:hypothetical protein
VESDVLPEVLIEPILRKQSTHGDGIQLAKISRRKHSDGEPPELKLTPDDFSLAKLSELDAEEFEDKIRGHDARTLAACFRQKINDNPESRLKKLADTIKGLLINRDDAIDGLMASFVAGVPVVLIGPPGTAKSLAIRLMYERCTKVGDRESGNKYFEYLMHAYTTPDELFGPPDVNQLIGSGDGENSESRYIRNTTGMLPDAEFVFLDEIFRGGPKVLNTLLSVINEKKFHNGPEVQSINMVNLVGASNEMRPDQDLGAFYDRFPIRIHTPSVLNSSGERSDLANRLLLKSLDIEQQSTPTQIACSNDFRAMRHCCTDLSRQFARGNSEVLTLFQDAFLGLRELRGIQFSDRSFPRLLKVGIAHAMLTTDSKSPPTWEAVSKVYEWTTHSELLREDVQRYIRSTIRSGRHGEL